MTPSKRLRLYAVAYLSAAPMTLGWLAGIFWHRVVDGWRVARNQLDRLDDAIIADMWRDKQ